MLVTHWRTLGMWGAGTLYLLQSDARTYGFPTKAASSTAYNYCLHLLLLFLYYLLQALYR